MGCMDAGFQNSKSVTKDCHYHSGKSAQRKQCNYIFEEENATTCKRHICTVYILHL